DAKPVMLLIIVYSRGPPAPLGLARLRGPLRPAPLARRLPAPSFQSTIDDGRWPIDDGRSLRRHPVFRPLRLEHLHLVERGIDALALQQTLMLSDLHDAAALEHDDGVRAHDR